MKTETKESIWISIFGLAVVSFLLYVIVDIATKIKQENNRIRKPMVIRVIIENSNQEMIPQSQTIERAITEYIKTNIQYQ